MKPLTAKRLIAMAGLPGTGKSTLARAIADALQRADRPHGAAKPPTPQVVVLDKDSVRAALFPPALVTYTTAQDDLCVEVLLQVATYLLRHTTVHTVILDGRTFRRAAQATPVVAAARALAGAVPTRLYWIKCTCAPETALLRLAADQASGAHQAANRDPALYHELRAQVEPLPFPHLEIDTEQPLDECLAACLAYLEKQK